MYVTVQFIILEILLGLIFLVILYFMLRELLKKIVRRELRDIKEPLQVLADFLRNQSEPEVDDPDQPGGPAGAGPATAGAARGPLPAASPEKLPEEPVDIADEFNQLKNTNRISAYNIRVQKIWDLYKQKKITLRQYKDELYRLKKEFGIATGEDDITPEKAPLKTAGTAKLKPLTPTPSAAPKEKVKKIDNEPEKGAASGDAAVHGPEKKQDGHLDGDKAASLDKP